MTVSISVALAISVSVALAIVGATLLLKLPIRLVRVKSIDIFEEPSIDVKTIEEKISPISWETPEAGVLETLLGVAPWITSYRTPQIRSERQSPAVSRIIEFYVSRHIEEKGHEHLLEYFTDCWENIPRKKYRLVIEDPEISKSKWKWFQAEVRPEVRRLLDYEDNAFSVVTDTPSVYLK